MTSREELQKPGYILVAPLDWGLGHAVRCLPLIEQLRTDKQPVLLGGDSQTLAFLRKHYPDLPGVELPAYRVRYPFRYMWFNMLWQSLRLLGTAWREHRILRKLRQQYPLKAIISDNRFGLFSNRVPCVYMTHQCHIPLRQLLLRRIANGLHRSVMRRFDEVWIPDNPPPRQLAPRLSTPPPGLRAHFVGLLTDQKPMVDRLPKTYRALAVLSGPEPQRTRLEELLREQFAPIPGKFALVRGTKKPYAKLADGSLTVVDLADRTLISSLTAKSELLIARSGYTTVMDLAASGQRALLVPTPGQPEQEYLAAHLHRQGYCYAVQQNRLDLSKDLRHAQAITGIPAAITIPGELLRERLTAWYQAISG